MKMNKTLLMVFALLIVSSMMLTACGGSGALAEDPVTLNWVWTTEPPTIDPSLATDTTSVDVVGNTFVGLTKFDPISGEVAPSLATSWESGEDAEGNQTWTFTLRDDVEWVKFNAETGKVEKQDRVVTAQDVVYGVKRTVDPETASDYSYVLYILKNAASINGGEEGMSVDDLGVEALDETTVKFTLERKAGYFPAIAGMWVANPMPQWAIEESGEAWTEPENFVSNGPYVLENWVHGGELNLAKNPFWINADDVQIERVHGVIIEEESTAFALYENGEVDTAAVPLPEMDRVKADPALSADYYEAPTPCTYYYGFVNTKPPFDDVRVRTAFAQSIDRQSLIDNVTKGGQIPATSLAPPGIFGAPAPGTVGLNYDPAVAMASLQEYLDAEGMTIEDFNALGVTLMHNTSEGHALIAAAIQQMWADNLGVEVTVENQEWKVYLDTIGKDTDIDQVPHVFRLGWCADYPDENNWIHEVFNSDEGANRVRTDNADFNALTVAAGEADDPAEREALYEQAEQMFAEEMVAFAPIYHYTTVNVTHQWLTRNFPPLGANDFYNWTLDDAARGQ
ncbi:MAG: peptide ABC transporter substrate-binding protein [Anaerolineae bacterium]|jgi:oligopeptide transport system substrate-binding protein|nr:peptide ABC transporter substrate-binding protein [Anaerolineae bacterium]MBT3714446.1 peptide ABC transporter substrate-binding protein [Anaerolineae bacterium]MBT4312569.1 peptide ABC transporter substrate-binding protein [Anaerolineae bacterium]MBT4457692.1 peptide ABC transporter substrate-binding protein [Anaerolineae bacterium]MBT4843463.1 peptide ABC transporter substrate-binding protein [Anaerolineae bacterium]